MGNRGDRITEKKKAFKIGMCFERCLFLGGEEHANSSFGSKSRGIFAIFIHLPSVCNQKKKTPSVFTLFYFSFYVFIFELFWAFYIGLVFKFMYYI